MGHLFRLRAEQDKCQIFSAAFAGAEATFAHSDALILSDKVFQMDGCTRSTYITV